jgi:hypothetical protein
MKFCGQCASPLGRLCPSCGFDNPSAFAFDGQCATPLTEQPPAPRPQAPLSYTPSHLVGKILTSKTALECERKTVRACYGVLAMQASVKQYAAEVQRTKGVPVQTRLRLNAGGVVVRSIGSDLHARPRSLPAMTATPGRAQTRAAARESGIAAALGV